MDPSDVKLTIPVQFLFFHDIILYDQILMSVWTVLVTMERATTPTVATPVIVNKGGPANTVMWVRNTSE